MIAVLRIQGAVGILGPLLFLAGIMTHATLLIVIGGAVTVADDVLSVLVGALKPLFPVVLAGTLALLVTPWWLGIFWASAVFAILDLPDSVKKLVRPHQVAARIQSPER